MRKSKTLQLALFYSFLHEPSLQGLSPPPARGCPTPTSFCATTPQRPAQQFTNTSLFLFKGRGKKKSIQHLQMCAQSCQMATTRLREVPPGRHTELFWEALQRAGQTLAGHLPKSRNGPAPAPGPCWHRCNKPFFSSLTHL